MEIIEPAKAKTGGRTNAKRQTEPAAEFVQHGPDLWGETTEAPRSSRRKKLAEAMNAGWSPDAQSLTYAQDQGLSPEQAIRAFEKFKLHYLGNGDRKDRWDAVWMKWLLNEKPPPTRGSGRGGRADKTAGLNF